MAYLFLPQAPGPATKKNKSTHIQVGGAGRLALWRTRKYLIKKKKVISYMHVHIRTYLVVSAVGTMMLKYGSSLSKTNCSISVVQGINSAVFRSTVMPYTSFRKGLPLPTSGRKFSPTHFSSFGLPRSAASDRWRERNTGRGRGKGCVIFYQNFLLARISRGLHICCYHNALLVIISFGVCIFVVTIMSCLSELLANV